MKQDNHATATVHQDQDTLRISLPDHLTEEQGEAMATAIANTVDPE